MLRLAQQRVAQIFARDQHPIGLELANLLAQHLYAARGIFHGEDGDGRVKAQLRAFAAGAADDAAGVARGGHLVQPDEVAARGAAARRHVTGIGRQQDPHALRGILLFGEQARTSSSLRPSSSSSTRR